MGRTACTEPQCLYRGALDFFLFNLYDEFILNRKGYERKRSWSKLRYRFGIFVQKVWRTMKKSQGSRPQNTQQDYFTSARAVQQEYAKFSAWVIWCVWKVSLLYLFTYQLTSSTDIIDWKYVTLDSSIHKLIFTLSKNVPHENLRLVLFVKVSVQRALSEIS
jgi:hypothetical protein